MLELTVCLDPGGGRPLYQQLYESLIQQIRDGRLRRGDRLPGKRSLAGQLAVAVNTVDTAYQMLVAEGYLEARPKSGFFVLEATDALPPRPAPAPAGEPAAPDPAPRFDLSTGAVDTNLFPFRTWGRIQKELLYAGSELLCHGHRQGDPDLRAALADYLRSYRGVACTPDQIVVGAGMEYLLGLLAQLLRGAAAAVENPGYDRPRTILENSGIPCRCVDIDGSGLDPAGLEESGASLCYVTPSHHFPTGVTMPVGRRAQLLRRRRAGPVHPGGRLRRGVPLRHAPRAQPPGHGGAGGAGGVPVYLLQKSGPQHPHCLHGAAPGSAGGVPPGLRQLLQHGQPL